MFDLRRRQVMERTRILAGYTDTVLIISHHGLNFGTFAAKGCNIAKVTIFSPLVYSRTAMK